MNSPFGSRLASPSSRAGGRMREHSHTSKPQARQDHPDVWQRDLNPDRMAGQNLGPGSDELAERHDTAFRLRKRGHPVPDLDDEELKQVPLVPQGTRLQQGATYVNLADE